MGIAVTYYTADLVRALPAVEWEAVTWRPAGAGGPLVLELTELFRTI